MTDYSTEMVASYELDGRTYQIHHLGFESPCQRAGYVVYRDGKQVADFLAFYTQLPPEFQPPLPGAPELIEMARRAVADSPIDLESLVALVVAQGREIRHLQARISSLEAFVDAPQP